MRRETTFNEVHDAQRYYRLLMDSMARPGKINTLYDKEVFPPGAINKATALIAFSLLNADVYFHYTGVNAEEVNNYILLNTSSSPVDVKHADFVFLNGKNESPIIPTMKTGSLPYPEEGATVIIDVELISDEFQDGTVGIELRGPGVNGELVVFVKGIQQSILEQLFETNGEFPLGVDAILTDKMNRIICIPRSNRFSWTHQI